MLYDKLLGIYTNNEFLRENFEFEINYKMLGEYISEEVNQGNTYLSPYRFSKMFSVDLEESIKFFLAISSPSQENNFIRIIYKYKCDECGALNFFSSNEVLKEDLTCNDCSEEVFGSSMDTDRFVLVFEISECLKKEFKSLKKQTLSRNDADIGKGITLSSASKIVEENPQINPELIDYFSKCWEIVRNGIR
ncbi:hypothetical protein [Enterococcus bulliens]